MDQFDTKNNPPHIDTSRFFQRMLENSQAAGIIVFDRYGLILDSSMGFQQSFGYSKEDLVGNHFHMLFTRENRLKNLPDIELNDVITKGTAEDNNYLLHKNGTRVWVHGESVLTNDDNGNVFIIKLLFDLNHQKLLENSLVEANKKLMQTEKDLKKKVEELDKINKDLDNFVYTASHDLKSPLNNIEALFTALYEDLSEESKNNVEQLKEMIITSLHKFKNTLNDLAIIGKVQANTDEAEINDFSGVLEDVKSNLMDLINRSGALIYTDFAAVPRINFSRKNLRSILTNLISNAIKYRSPDKTPEVRVRTDKYEDFIIISVEDNGVGIRELDKNRIFDLYQRLNDNVEGTGVGLSIVKRIAEMHGGKVEVESELGKGSTFKAYVKERKN